MGFPKWKQRLELKKFCRTSKAFIPDLGGGRCAITVYWLKNGRQEAIGTWGVGLEMVRKRVLDKDKAPVESTHKRNKSGPKMVKISWSWGDWKPEVISCWSMRKREKKGTKTSGRRCPVQAQVNAQGAAAAVMTNQSLGSIGWELTRKTKKVIEFGKGIGQRGSYTHPLVGIYSHSVLQFWHWAMQRPRNLWDFEFGPKNR